MAILPSSIVLNLTGGLQKEPMTYGGPGKKFDTGKLPFDLLPVVATEQVVGVLGYGASKYGAENWRNLEDPMRRYYAAAQRHLFAWKRGEILDPESGLPHLAHAACSLMFLLDLEQGKDVYTGEHNA